MNKTQTVKYIRVAEDKKHLILLPSKIGIEPIKKVLDFASIKYVEGVEIIDKAKLISIIIDFESELRHFEYKVGIGGMIGIYVYTAREKKIYINLPFEL